MNTGQNTSHVDAARPGLRRTVGDRGPDDLVEVSRRVERVHVEAVADLTGEPRHARVHARDRDGMSGWSLGPGEKKSVSNENE